MTQKNPMGNYLKQRYLDPAFITVDKLNDILKMEDDQYIPRLIAGEERLTESFSIRLAHLFGVPSDWFSVKEIELLKEQEKESGNE